MFVKKAGLLGITNFLVALNTLILIPILTKNLTTNDYGIWVQVLTTFFLITSIAGLGLPYTIIRFLSHETDESRIQEGFYSMVVVVLISSFIISMIIIIFSEDIANSLFNHNVLVVQLLALLIFFGPINSLLINLFVAFNQMKKYSFLLLFQTYISLFLMSVFAILGFGILLVIFGFFLSQFVLFILMTCIIINQIGLKIPKFYNIKEYLNFAIPIIPNNLANWIVESSDRYVIGFIMGTVFVAYYAPGYTLGMTILLFFTPLSVLLSSILPKYYEYGDISEVMLIINYSLKYFLLVAIPSFFMLAILSKPILMVMTTSEIALNGYTVTPFIALSSLLFGALGIILNMVILEKKTKIIGIIWSIAAIITLLNLILVPIFGILAAAVVTLVSYSTAFLLGIIYSRKFFKYYFDYSFVIKSILSSLFVTFLIVIINPTGLFSLIIVIVFSIAVYVGSIFLMKCIDKNEIEFFKSILER